MNAVLARLLLTVFTGTYPGIAPASAPAFIAGSRPRDRRHDGGRARLA
jgi:hypothetical protein